MRSSPTRCLCRPTLEATVLLPYHLPLDAPPPRKASAFAQSFGTVDVASNVGKEVLGAKPVHAQAERDGARNALHQRLDVLKKRDELTTKMESRTCIDVTAQRCMQCEYLQIRALPECKERGHDLRAIRSSAA